MSKHPLRIVIENYEESIKDDFDVTKPVVCIRKEESNPETQTLVWGDDWESHFIERTCGLCGVTLLARPIFSENPLVCLPCCNAIATSGSA